MNISLYVRMAVTLLISTVVAAIIIGSIGAGSVAFVRFFGAPSWVGVVIAIGFTLGVAVWVRNTGVDVLYQIGGYAVDRSDYPELTEPLQRLATQAGVTVPGLAVVATDDPFAFTYKTRDEGHRIVVSRGLVELLDSDEREAILAHELTHVMNRDLTVMQLGFFPIRLAEAIQSVMAHGGTARGASGRNRPTRVTIPRAIYDLAVGLERLGVFATAQLASAREFAADRGAVELTGNPAALSTALATLYDQAAQPAHDLRDSDRARLLNITPVGRPTTRLLGFSTHPDLHARQRQLRELAAEMEAT